MIRNWLKPGESSSTDAPIECTRFVVIDTELTSLDQRTNRLLSVGAIGMMGAKIQLGEQFYRLVNPGVDVPAQSIVIHRLRPEDIERGDDLRKAIEELNSFLHAAVLVGHFAEIDRDALRKEFSVYGIQLLNPMICTARVHRWIVKRQPYTEDKFRELETTDLVSLAKFYNVDVHEAHHALDDAFVTARLWQKQIHRLQEMGVITVRGLLRIAKV
jgi:DNA polymerase-3 subunit epsilon